MYGYILADMPKHGLCALVFLLFATLADVAAAATILDLRRELEVADTLDSQLEVVGRMRAKVREGTVNPNQVGMVVYVLSRKPVFKHREAMSLVRDMLADPDLDAEAAGTLANQFSQDHISDEIAREVAQMLLKVQTERVLPVPRMADLRYALTPSVPLYKRELALEILMARPPAGDNRTRYFDGIAGMLDPEFTLAERKAAVKILAEAAEIGDLPGRGWGALSRAAKREPDHALRVSVWPAIMPTETDRRGRYVLGANLTDQLTGPATESRPSFDDADEATRERAVMLLNNYWDTWEERYPDIYKDALVQMVVRHGSPASLAKVKELRARNELSEEHLAALGDIELGDPVLASTLEEVVQPNLAPGSLVGPVEVLRTSSNKDEREAARQRLLQEHPTGTVPMEVAEVAYLDMKGRWGYNAAAASLVARGDEPFADKEKKILALVDEVPRPTGTIAEALRVLIGAPDMQGVVVKYASDERIEETMRASLLGLLYNQMRDGGDIDSRTIAAVEALGRSAENYGTISAASRLLETAGVGIPWQMRVRDKSFQWSALMLTGLGSLVLGGISAVGWLVFVTTPSRVSGRSGGKRFASFGGLLVFVAAYIGCALFALLFSLGHTSTPSPRPAAPFYLGCVIIAITMAVLTIRMYRSMPPEQGKPSER